MENLGKYEAAPQLKRSRLPPIGGSKGDAGNTCPSSPGPIFSISGGFWEQMAKVTDWRSHIWV